MQGCTCVFACSQALMSTFTLGLVLKSFIFAKCYNLPMSFRLKNHFFVLILFKFYLCFCIFTFIYFLVLLMIFFFLFDFTKCNIFFLTFVYSVLLRIVCLRRAESRGVRLVFTQRDPARARPNSARICRVLGHVPRRGVT